MALDIARGLSYLADLKFVHRLVFSRPFIFLCRYLNYHFLNFEDMCMHFQSQVTLFCNSYDRPL